MGTEASQLEVGSNKCVVRSQAGGLRNGAVLRLHFADYKNVQELNSPSRQRVERRPVQVSSSWQLYFCCCPKQSGLAQRKLPESEDFGQGRGHWRTPSFLVIPVWITEQGQGRASVSLRPSPLDWHRAHSMRQPQQNELLDRKTSFCLHGLTEIWGNIDTLGKKNWVSFPGQFSSWFQSVWLF